MPLGQVQRLYGYEAIEWHRAMGGILCKYWDVHEPAAYDIDRMYAIEVACEDPDLVWIDVRKEVEA